MLFIYLFLWKDVHNLVKGSNANFESGKWNWLLILNDVIYNSIIKMNLKQNEFKVHLKYIFDN